MSEFRNLFACTSYPENGGFLLKVSRCMSTLTGQVHTVLTGEL
jgi:hypothetical protein